MTREAISDAKTPPARARAGAAALLAAVAAVAAATGCGLPAKTRALLAKPTPTPLPTATPLPVPPLKMEFVRIREDRARGEAGKPACEIDVELGGAIRAEIAAARVLVQVAVDDLGTSLVLEGTPAFGPLPPGEPGAAVVLPVPLKVAPRRATSLGEVSGEIELYVPGSDPAAPKLDGNLDPKRLPPSTLRRYRFSLKGVPLP